MMLYSEKIAPSGPLPTEPPDVLAFERSIESLEAENVWLKERLVRMVRDK
jgi:hypothetical protein